MPTQSRTLVQRALGPADRLLSRLWYPQKFVLIGLVLILPLGWVVKSYVGVQSTNTAFAQQEAVGVAYLRPASELLARVVAARRVAVQVASHQSGQAQLDLAVRQVRTAIAGVDAMHGAERHARPQCAVVRAQTGRHRFHRRGRRAVLGRHPGGLGLDTGDLGLDRADCGLSPRSRWHSEHSRGARGPVSAHGVTYCAE